MAGNFYELMEVDRDASRSEIKGAYREKAREYHPDVNEDPRARDQFATLNKARNVLTNPKERDRYDRLGHRDYVSQHLDGLPTMSRPGESEAAMDTQDTEPSGDVDGSATGVSGGPTGAGGTSSGPATVGGGSDSSRASTDSGTTSSTYDSAPGGSSRSGTSSTPSGTSSAPSGTSSTPSGTSSTPSGTSSTPSGTSSTPSGTSSTPSGTSSTTSSTSSNRNQTTAGSSSRTRRDRTSRTTRRRKTGTSTSAHRRGLQRGWNASLVAFVLYLCGLAGYVWLAIDSVDVAVGELSTHPQAALLASSPLPGPMTVVITATAPLTDGGVSAAVVAGVLVAIGFLALPMAIGVTVAKYGRGSAYLYVAAVAVPVCWTVARPFVPAPLAADLLALAAVPLVGGAWFLVDIGRYLRSAAKP